jgi:homoserine O-acetyltransferase
MSLLELSRPEDPFCRPARREATSHVALRGGRDVIADIPTDFRLESGERLGQRRLVGRLVGTKDAPVVVVAGGISADRFVHKTETGGRGWWSGAVGVRGPVDLNRFQVLSFDYAPDAGGRAPVTITTRDQARLLALLLDAVEIETVAAFVGASYGGMVGLAFAELFPDRIDSLVVISAAHRAHPIGTAWRGVQRRILKLAAEAGRAEDGVALARELAMTTYRTGEEFAERFTSEAPTTAGGTYPVCDYLTAQGRSYRGRMTAERWISLSDSIDRHQVTPEAIQTPVTLVGFTTDRLAPIDDLRELAARLPTLWRFVEAPSLYGHDAFLKEEALIGQVLRQALKEIEQ